MKEKGTKIHLASFGPNAGVKTFYLLFHLLFETILKRNMA